LWSEGAAHDQSVAGRLSETGRGRSVLWVVAKEGDHG